ncbi:MAG: hypothetical protein ACP5OU_00065 [Methanothrix sp.]
MSKSLIFLASILISVLAAAAVSAQEINATDDNATLNNTTLNSTIVEDAAAGSENASALGQVQSGESATPMSLDIEAAGAKNLSTASVTKASVMPISQMAGIAPLVAAGASSIQVADEPADSIRIGTVVDGIDNLKPDHLEVEPLSLGIPIKPMRDTGKMFFVCDLV